MSTPLVITFLLPDGRSTHLGNQVFFISGGHNTQRTSRGLSQYGSFFWYEVIYLVYTSCIYQMQCHQSIFRQVSGKHIHDLWQCETSNARWWACSGSGTCVYKVFAADRGSIYCVYKRHLLLTYTNIYLLYSSSRQKMTKVYPLAMVTVIFEQYIGHAIQTENSACKTNYWSKLALLEVQCLSVHHFIYNICNLNHAWIIDHNCMFFSYYTLL